MARRGGPTERSARELALACSTAAGEKKAVNVLVLDMRGLSPITDYFVLCSGQSSRQVKAIAGAIVESAAARGVRSLRSEGWTDARWIVIDFGEVIAHIFVEEARRYYRLERLWGDAKILRITA